MIWALGVSWDGKNFPVWSWLRPFFDTHGSVMCIYLPVFYTGFWLYGWSKCLLFLLSELNCSCKNEYSMFEMKMIHTTQCLKIMDINIHQPPGYTKGCWILRLRLPPKLRKDVPEILGVNQISLCFGKWPEHIMKLTWQGSAMFCIILIAIKLKMKL